jgi:hypothetical protein
VTINGSIPPNGSQVAFISPDLSVTYAVFNLVVGYFQAILDAPVGTDFIMVVWTPNPAPDGLYYVFPSNGNAMIHTTDCMGPFEHNSGFESFFTNQPITGSGSPTLAGVLPVEFLSFTAKADSDNTVRLEWATVWEEDNDHFTVERSIDGANFQALGQVDGAGTTIEQQDYVWIDDSPLPGINYYRIKQTDFDGAFEYSDVASVRMNGNLGQDMRIFPNPAEAQVRIVLPSVGKSGTAIVRVFNQVGQLVLSREQSTEGQLLEFDTSALPQGVYTLHVQEGARSYSEKLVVK